MDSIHHLHIGMRKIKSILAVFLGFCIWQGIRVFFPDLEVHPIFIYIYGLLEIRESSEKTVDMGLLRIKATLVAILIGIPLLVLSLFLQSLTSLETLKLVIDISIILVGVLLVLCVAEYFKCRTFCGLAAAIFIILVAIHSDDQPLTYALLRVLQTVIGVFIAWLLNTKIFPYPEKSKK